MNKKEIACLSDKATREVADILDELERGFPGVTEGASALLGSALGGAGALATLSALGTTGLSAAGITSGLAAAGMGAGMVAGIGVLAAPIAVLGIAGYAIAKKQKAAKLATALNRAIKKLYDIQDQLIANAEYFKEELAGIKATIQFLKKKQPS
ncbi:MAG: hypothetical protein ACRC5H_07270 [Treponemataceae bacterium]